jgi:hypothetical protein
LAAGLLAPSGLSSETTIVVFSRSTARIVRVGALMLACSLAFSAVSCGNGRKPLFAVKGRVVDGKNQPAVNALVIFHPTDAASLPGILPQGRVDRDGYFTLTTYDKDDGAPAGQYVVTVFWQRPQTSPFDGDGPDILGGRYNDPKKSTISFTVEPTPTNLVPDIQVIVTGVK